MYQQPYHSDTGGTSVCAGACATAETLSAYSKNSHHRLRIEGILITMDSANTILSTQVNDMIQQGFADKVPIFKTRIPRSIKVAEAVLYHQTISEFLPNNSAAIAYEQFVDELLSKEQGKTAERSA